MTDLNVSLILRLVDKATAPARAAMRTLERLGGEGMMRQAALVTRGSHMMASGLGTMTGAATRGLGVLTDYRTILGGLGLAATASSFINTASEFENFNVQLENLEGSAEGAKRAMSWIETFATKTPLQMDQTVAAYTKLKAFGIDPMNGTLQSLVDTMAATGGGAEKLEGMVLAVGQAYTKGKLQGEEAMQLLERGVPVYDLLAKKMGKTTEEIVDMQAKGKLGREEIALLVEAMGEANLGASDKMSQTWDGVISNLWDHWSRFQRQVMASGLFVYLKDKIAGLLDLLNKMAANGDLQRWAENVGRAVQGGLEALWNFGAGLVEVWQTVAPWIRWAADAVGGFGNAAMILIGLKFAGVIFGVVAGFVQLSVGLGVATAGLLSFLVPLLRSSRVIALAKGGMTLLASAVTFVGRALLIAGRAALANPLILALTAIAGLAYVIYDSWSGIVGYFRDKVDRVAAAFDQGLLNGVLKLLSEFNPFVLIMDAAEGLFTYITGWTFGDVRAAIADAFGFDPFTELYNAAERLFNYLTGWTFGDVSTALTNAFTSIDFVQIGIDMMNNLWAGIRQVMDQLVTSAKEKLASITPDFSGMFGGGSTDGESGDIGMAGATDGQRATGGPVRAGGIYRWNEQGKELFSPTTDGTVINARQVKAMAGGAARSMSLNLGGVTINAAPGTSPQAIAREVRREMERLARENGFGLHDGGNYA